MSERNSDVYVLNFLTSGESLSDMIFKPLQDDAQPVPPSKPHPPPLSPSLSCGIVAQDTLSSEYRGRDDVPNPARVRGTDTKTSLTLSSDSSSSEAWASSVASNSDGEESEQDRAETPKTATSTESKPRSGSAVALVQETVVSGLAMVSVTPLRIVTKENVDHSDNSSAENSESLVKSTRATMDPKCNGSDEQVKHSPLQRIPGLMKVHNELDHPSTFTPYNGADEPIESPPQMQPNSSDSSPSISSLSSAASRREDRCEVSSRRDYGYTKVIVQDDFERIRTSEATSTGPSAYSSQAITAISPSALVLASTSTSVTQPPSLPSLQLTATSSTTGSSATATPSTPVSVSRSKSSIISPIQYWRSRQSSSSHGVNSSSSSPSSFSQNYITNTFKKKKPIIPTIVIHPDEEGGEPPRVLSQKDIEYLSMMTPAPLRPLIQPWDDISEEDEYDEELKNEGHVYDDRHPHQYNHPQHCRGEYGTILEEDEENSGDFEIHRMEGIDRNDGLGEDYDTYALDVPVDLDVELELAASDNNRATYGYV
ncbi:hypothetical protein BGZ98_001448 [Dissophora globulifera]|nr:hypothetical protein BGZ98_001448 [Dissophora globulifera]